MSYNILVFSWLSMFVFSVSDVNSYDTGHVTASDVSSVSWCNKIMSTPKFSANVVSVLVRWRSNTEPTFPERFRISAMVLTFFFVKTSPSHYLYRPFPYGGIFTIFYLIILMKSSHYRSHIHHHFFHTQFNPYNAEIYLYKPWRQVFLIWNDVLVSSFHFIWIHMLWIYGH